MQTGTKIIIPPDRNIHHELEVVILVGKPGEFIDKNTAIDKDEIMIIKPNNPYKIFLLFSIYKIVDNVNKIIPKYSLTEGLTEKIYRKLIEQVLEKITNLSEWHSKEILNKIGNVSWSKSIFYLHEKKVKDLNSQYYRRLAYDEILSNLLILSQVRRRIKKIKKLKGNKCIFSCVRCGIFNINIVKSNFFFS